MIPDQADEDEWHMRGYELEGGETGEEIIADFLGPVFEELESQDEVETFHFNLNGDVLNLRIYPDLGDLEGVLDSLENDHDRDHVEGEWPNRDQDKNRVGGKNIQAIDKHREYGSKAAIEAAKAGLSDDERQGFIERGCHLFANDMGVYLDIYPKVEIDVHGNPKINGLLKWVENEHY